MVKKNKNKETRYISRLIAYKNSKSPITERYRSIRTNLEYAQVDKSLKTIAVTSASPSEGKSTTIANLAVTYAQQGKKVILIDADLRKPSLQQVFRTENVNGLTDILMKKITVTDGIQEVDGIPGLHMIPAGFIPLYPAELLSSQNMTELLERLSEIFDIILIDTPPVLVATDAQIISSICDGMLIVVKSEKTERKALLDAKKNLEQVNSNILGVIFNHTEKTVDNSYYKYK